MNCLILILLLLCGGNNGSCPDQGCGCNNRRSNDRCGWAGRDAAAGTVAATMTARKMRGVGAAMISVPNPGSSKGRFPLTQTRYADARNLPTTIVTGKGMIPSY